MSDKALTVMEELIEEESIDCPDCIARIIVIEMAIEMLSSVRAKTKKEGTVLEAGIEMLKGIVPTEHGEYDEQCWEVLRECADYILEQRGKTLKDGS